MLSLVGVRTKKARDKLVNCGSTVVGSCAGEDSRQLQLSLSYEEENHASVDNWEPPRR